MKCTTFKKLIKQLYFNQNTFIFVYLHSVTSPVSKSNFTVCKYIKINYFD